MLFTTHNGVTLKVFFFASFTIKKIIRFRPFSVTNIKDVYSEKVEIKTMSTIEHYRYPTNVPQLISQFFPNLMIYPRWFTMV